MTNEQKLIAEIAARMFSAYINSNRVAEDTLDKCLEKAKIIVTRAVQTKIENDGESR